MAKDRSIAPKKKEKSLPYKAGEVTGNAVYQGGRAVGKGVGYTAKGVWDFGQGLGEGLGLNTAGEKLGKWTYEKKDEEYAKPTLSKEDEIFQQTTRARRAKDRTIAPIQKKIAESRERAEANFDHNERIKESKKARFDKYRDSATPTEAMSRQVSDAQAAQRAKGEASARNAEYELLMDENASAIDEMDAKEDARRDAAKAARRGGVDAVRETRRAAQQLTKDTLSPYKESVKKYGGKSNVVDKNLVSEADAEQLADDRRSAQSAAEQESAMSNVDRRRRDLEAYKFRAEKLAKQAQAAGYKHVTAESVMEQARQRMERNRAKEDSRKASLGDKYTQQYGGFKSEHDERMAMLSEMGNDFNKNQNKKFMAQRGAQMNADLKAREDAVRNNPRAAEKRAALKAQWGNPTMSQNQMEAKARWDAKRDIASGTRGNLSAFPQQKAYRASPQYGQDVYGMAQQQGRTLTPGSVGSTYEQNYNFNKNLSDAQLRSAQGLANVVDQVSVNGKPTTSQVKGVANTPIVQNNGEKPLGA